MMQLARIQGKVTSTIKHASFNGQKLLVCQPLGSDYQVCGDPLIAIDPLHAGIGDLVYLSSDSQRLRQIVNDKTTPIRWFILGILDE